MTLWQILDRIWLELWQKPSSTVFSRQNLIYDINSTLSAILKWRVKSLIDPSRIFLSTRLAFNESAYKNHVPIRTSVTKQALAWETELFFPTGAMSNNWYIYCAWDILQYNSKESNKVILSNSLITDIDITTWVYEVFLLPEEFLIPISLTIKDKNGTTLTTLPIFNDNKNFHYYEIIQTNTGSFLKIEHSFSSWYFFELLYSKKAVDLTEDGDVCILPEHYPLSVVANIVAWENAIRKWFPWGEQILNKGYSSLQEMYSFFDTKDKPRKTSIKPISYFKR